jgi:group II intron reverse transcriptase/maturase
MPIDETQAEYVNGASLDVADSLEGRGRTEGNMLKSNRCRVQNRENLQQALDRVRWAAERERTAQFTSIWHLVCDMERLAKAFRAIKRQSASGIDGETKQEYEKRLDENLADLSSRLSRGAYHAKPVKRVYIPKADGRMRPLGVPALEDKIVQRAAAEVLQTIYEADFHDFSYGFRPGRSQHQALDTLAVGIRQRPLNWVLDADIRGFFDNIDHEWLMAFIKHRIADKRVWRHIQKWLHAGVFEDGEVRSAEYGTPQGGSISPLLANIYLHYAFDNWANRWRGTEATGDMQIVRFADDVVVSFEHREDAERFLAGMQERLRRFHLELNMEKTRLIEFGRNARQARRDRGEGSPATFDFLGFTHYCGQTRNGGFLVKRQTARKKMKAKLQELGKELRKRMHDPVHMVGAWLGRVLEGHYQYYAVPFNFPKLAAFRNHLLMRWVKTLGRRSQKAKTTRESIQYLSRRYLPQPRILHPYPEQRLRVTYPR